MSYGLFTQLKRSCPIQNEEKVRVSLFANTKLNFYKIPWSDMNSTGKFLSPRLLDPIFTWLTALNCNKIYTIGKPNIFSIC